MLFILTACWQKEDFETAGGTGWETGFDTADDTADDTAPFTDFDGDGSPAGEDCDDFDPTRYPGAPELCDGIDQDCDGDIDEDVTTTFYGDADGDGYGRADDPVEACADGAGIADNPDDCDDADAAVHPGVEDVANGEDDDCDGAIDEDATAFSATVTWRSGGVDLAITGSAGGWELGMSETGAGSVGWFGESCIPGAEPWGYDDYGWDVCHTLPVTGGFIPSVYPDIGSVDDGHTLFNADIGNRGDITYVLFDTASAACWVFGDDPTYYDDFGCTAI